MGNKCFKGSSKAPKSKIRANVPSRQPIGVPSYSQQKLSDEFPLMKQQTANNTGTTRPKSYISIAKRVKKPKPTHANVILIALYPFESSGEGELSFKKGDQMVLLDDSNSDWWYVHQLGTDLEGYVPQNYVAKQKSPESEDWYAGKIRRSMAEKLVLGSGLSCGTYLIRERKSKQREYALTIRDDDKGDVKHYKIKRMDNDGRFYITTQRLFVSLQELVQFYSDNADGLCHRLVNPCPRPASNGLDLSQEVQKNWEIPSNQLQFCRQLGQGNFGIVYAGKWNNYVDVAIKTIRPGAMSREAFLKEAAIMGQCQHKNLIKLLAIRSKEEPICIVTEFMTNGSLLDYLAKGDGRNLTLRDLVDICAQIANGMAYLEEHRMVHRDLAARNVLVGDKVGDAPVVKVADFGLARIIIDNEYNARNGAKFPFRWTAPEALLYGSFTIKSDVWSYGVLLYEIITKGQKPYPGMENHEIVQQVELGYRMPPPIDCPAPMYDKMLQCWDRLPNERPTFESLFLYFNDYFVLVQPN